MYTTNFIESQRAESDKKSVADQVRSGFLSLNPDVRRNVMSGVFGFALGLLNALGHLGKAVASKTNFTNPAPISDLITLLLVTLGIYNVAVSRTRRAAACASRCGGSPAASISTGFTST